MKIYKFGGSSIKNSKRVKTLSKVIKSVGSKNTVIVISAIGKTTNKLEKVVNTYFLKKSPYIFLFEIEKNHLKMIKNLFFNKNYYVLNILFYFNNIYFFLKKNNILNYNFIYDQIVGAGELISTKIISDYLNYKNIKNIWIDCRNFLKTDNCFREAHVNWKQTKKQIKKLNKKFSYLTQGFIGADNNYYTTTLGREGSDYTASIFSYCLNAKSQTTWKDVPGILNADPKGFKQTTFLKSLSFEEAFELSYYGASIIHLNTLHPLKTKKIPLYVRSFFLPKKKGTLIKKTKQINFKNSFFILKKQTILLSFFIKKNLSEILNFVSNKQIKILLIQYSSISLTVCLEDKFNNIMNIILNLKNKFIIKKINNVELYTIIHYKKYNEKNCFKNKKILLRQINFDTAQWVLKQ
ncbi:MAG: aspartate kinase [Candidatus Karelsulcia muelleri]|nr:MAG: aspartate kinase [Candidatus Karelsulcia muelleri]